MAKFVQSADSVNAIKVNDQKTEFCFVGRSNVGKSTLINALANQKIARTSKQPGRTQLINVFDFDDFRLIDLPGYGYANVSKAKHYDINQILIDYLSNRSNLFGVFLVCDIAHITQMDVDVYKNICKHYKNVYILLNKVDKVAKSYFDNAKSKIAKQFAILPQNLIPISALNKTNVSYLKKLIRALDKI